MNLKIFAKIVIPFEYSSQDFPLPPLLRESLPRVVGRASRGGKVCRELSARFPAAGNLAVPEFLIET
jgi:hypothetical protein